VAIFGGITARQRLRRATQESLATPVSSSFVDCAPWVIGGLWHGELAALTAENATLASYLRADLQRITRSANDALKIIKRAGLADSVRQAYEARIIGEARASAVRRVESTIRHVRAMKAEMLAGPRRARVTERFAGTDIDKTQVRAAVTGVERAAPAPTDTAPEPQESTDTDRHETSVAPSLAAAPLAADPDERVASVARHCAPDDDDPATAVITPEPEMPQAPEVPEISEALGIVEVSETIETPESPPTPEAPEIVDAPEIMDAAQTVEVPVGAESDSERLQRLLTFMVQQEPRLNWAVGDHADGTTVLVTDVAHGWIPPGITLPAGVRLLQPGRRAGKVSALVGEATRMVTYTPGDAMDRPADFAAMKSSVQPRELPAVDDLGWELGRATHWRDGVPRMVHTLVKAAVAGTCVVEEEEEVDLLRAHLDTARYQVLIQYPDVGSALLLNCLLLAATESLVTGDSISANYHFAWFQKLDDAPASQRTAEP
jgi:Family of unknown function (DUF5631)/Family of unknown function (DUF5632)